MQGQTTGFSVKSLLSVLMAVSLVTLSGGCASVKLGGDKQPVTVSAPSTQKQTDTIEKATPHSGLMQAANALRQKPWPEIEKASATEKLTGMIFGERTRDDRFTRDDALELYVSQIRAQPEPADSVIRADADESLRLARALVEEARSAAHTVNPDRTDMDMLEDAIGDIRECRDMYVDAMRELGREDAISRQDWQELKQAFNQAITDAGRTADLLSDQLAAAQQRSSFAGSTVYAPRQN